MKILYGALLGLAMMTVSNEAVSASVSGTIVRVHAGTDGWFGVRFYLDVSNDATGGVCNSAFVYSEPETGNGHKEKVAVLLAAYLADKKVALTVGEGRNGYCKLLEGFIH